jgi:hypothetical protein
MPGVCVYLGLVCTLYMTGVVWFAQLVHYPLLDRGDLAQFTAFARAYRRRTLWVVTPALAGEVGTAILLMWLSPSLQSAAGLVTLTAVWVSTVFWVIPAHLKLRHGYDREWHRRLVRRNLPRSLLWTLRSVVMIWTTVTWRGV